MFDDVHTVGCEIDPRPDDEGKVMNIEYDFQQFGTDYWGVFVRTEAFAKMHRYFGDANTVIHVHPNDTTLPPIEIPSYDDLLAYVTLLYDRDHTMYFLGILDQDPRDEYYIGKDAAGFIFGPGPDFASVSFTGFMWWEFNKPKYTNWNDETIKDCIERVVIHELGHQRSDLKDQFDVQQWDHDIEFHCAMWAGLADPDSPHDFLAYYDFCGQCKDKIRENDWWKNY